MILDDDEVLQDVEIEPINQPASKKKTKVKTRRHLIVF